MSRITVDGQVQEVFDDDDLDASYRAVFTSDGGVAVRVEVRRGDVLLATLPVADFRADQASGFGEEG